MTWWRKLEEGGTYGVAPDGEVRRAAVLIILSASTTQDDELDGFDGEEQGRGA